MPTTPTYALRYQALTDPPDGAALGEDLATDVETELVRIDGDIATVNTGVLTVGSVAPLFTAWATHSLAWTSSGTAPALGSSTVVARYKQVGKLVFYTFRVDFAAATFGTGTYRISLPVGANAAGNYFGTGWFRDASSSSNGYANGMCWIDGTAATTYLTFASNTGVGLGAPVTSTNPFTWANTDILAGSITYEAA